MVSSSEDTRGISLLEASRFPIQPYFCPFAEFPTKIISVQSLYVELKISTCLIFLFPNFGAPILSPFPFLFKCYSLQRSPPPWGPPWPPHLQMFSCLPEFWQHLLQVPYSPLMSILAQGTLCAFADLHPEMGWTADPLKVLPTCYSLECVDFRSPELWLRLLRERMYPTLSSGP